MRIHDELSRSVIGAFFEVYNRLGFGFLEVIYVRALEYELRERGHRVGREVGVEVRYKHLTIGRQYMDMIVDERLLVEAKSTEVLHPTAKRQTYNYLRATGMPVGLVLHFGPKPKAHRVEYRPASWQVARSS